MASNKDWFNTYRLVNSNSVLIDNNASYRVIMIEDVRIKMVNGAVRTLGDIRYIPYLKKNLISLGMLNSSNCCYKSTSRVMKVGKDALTGMKRHILAGNIYRLLDIKF